MAKEDRASAGRVLAGIVREAGLTGGGVVDELGAAKADHKFSSPGAGGRVIDLAPEYSQQISAEHAKIAGESLGLIRTKVAQVRGMDAYPQNARVRNIFSGYY